jgi:hypothetical protein
MCWKLQVEAAYDMLLMQSLSQRRAGKVVDNTIRYADVRKAKSPVSGSGPEWLRTALKTAPVAFQTPSLSTVGMQTGVYLALSVWLFASALTSSPGELSVSGKADVPGVILAIGFGLSVYFLSKQKMKLGKHDGYLNCAFCFCPYQGGFQFFVDISFLVFSLRSCTPSFSFQLRILSSLSYTHSYEQSERGAKPPQLASY